MVSEQTRQVVVVTPTKSAGVAILLTVLFGPLGMFYSTIAFSMSIQCEQNKCSRTAAISLVLC
jgi:hypothetical protein